MNFSSRLKKSVIVIIEASLLALCGCSSGGSGQTIPIIPNNTGTVSGTIRYQDKEYDKTGFNCITCSNLFKTVRYAVVEVVDTASGKVLSSGTTGANGSYSLSYSDAGAMVYVRVIAEAEINNVSLVRVRDLGGATYAVASGNVSSDSSATANLDIDLVQYSQVSAAFNILDVLTSGFQFIDSLAGVYPPQLSAFWEYNSSYSTFYCSSGCLPGTGIYIIGNNGGDTDGYDDDVILHEFGHFIAGNLSRDDSPGGAHYLGQNDLDLRLAWSEGWGNFMPLATRNWMAANDSARISSIDPSPTIYVDTNDSLTPPVNFYIDFGIQNNNDFLDWWSFCSSPSNCFSYSSNEVAVTNVLWNSMTGTGNFKMQAIWNVVSSWHNLDNTSLPLVNLESFWDTWIAQRSLGGNEYDAGYTTELNALWAIYSTVNIIYKKDVYEDDGSIALAKPIDLGVPNAQQHTLYTASGQNDSDYYVFSTAAAGSFSAATSGLANGADTFVAVYDSGANVITSNDNQFNIANPQNNTTDLSSKVTFSSSGAATYYIEVKSSPNRPDSAGRYGTYMLTITSP